MCLGGRVGETKEQQYRGSHRIEGATHDNWELALAQCLLAGLLGRTLLEIWRKDWPRSWSLGKHSSSKSTSRPHHSSNETIWDNKYWTKTVTIIINHHDNTATWWDCLGTFWCLVRFSHCCRGWVALRNQTKK